MLIISLYEIISLTNRDKIFVNLFIYFFMEGTKFFRIFIRDNYFDDKCVFRRKFVKYFTMHFLYSDNFQTLFFLECFNISETIFKF